MGSLNEEIDAEGSPVGVHTLSPGMVLTPLLLEGATDRNKAIFNILCEQPETVAAFLTPRIRQGHFLAEWTFGSSLQHDCRAFVLPFFRQKCCVWKQHVGPKHCKIWEGSVKNFDAVESAASSSQAFWDCFKVYSLHAGASLQKVVEGDTSVS